MDKKKKIIIGILIFIIVALLAFSAYLLFFKDSGTNSNSSDNGNSSSTNSNSSSNSGSSDIVIIPDEPIASDLVDTQKLFMEAEVDYPLPEGCTKTELEYVPKTVYVSVPKSIQELKLENNKWVNNSIPSDYSGFTLEPRYRDGGSGNTDYYTKQDPKKTSSESEKLRRYTISIGGTIGSRSDKSKKYSNGEEALDGLIYNISKEALVHYDYNDECKINIDKSKEVVINGVTMYNYEGYQEYFKDSNGNYTYKEYLVGYAFAVDGAAYQISGILYDSSYKDEMVTMLTNIVKSVRTEK